jgi:hypothetical protein
MARSSASSRTTSMSTGVAKKYDMLPAPRELGSLTDAGLVWREGVMCGTVRSSQQGAVGAEDGCAEVEMSRGKASRESGNGSGSERALLRGRTDYTVLQVGRMRRHCRPSSPLETKCLPGYRGGVRAAICTQVPIPM